MKLSEAIRLGAMLKRKGCGSKAMYPGATRTCALGAANEAAGIEECGDIFEVMARTWPVLEDSVEMPTCRKHWHVVAERGKPTLLDAIWILNDSAHWTRERIADWVETIEAQHEASVAEDSAAQAVESRPVVCGVETTN